MKSLVTGASGMVGLRLVECLVERYGKESVIAVIGTEPKSPGSSRLNRLNRLGVKQIHADLNKPFSMDPEIASVNCVFHLAANLRTDIRDESENSPIRVNDLGTLNLITSLAEDLRGKIFVYASSIAAVDRDHPETQRMTEDSPCVPRTTYGTTKLRGEKIIKETAQKFGFSYVIFRLGTVYGPDCREGHIFDQLTKNVDRNALGARINWPGKISLIHVDDVVDVLIDSAKQEQYENEIFFLSNQEDVTVGEWIKIIAGVRGKEIKAIRLPQWLTRALSALFYQYGFWKHMPSAFALAAWRLSLVLNDGFYCDSTKLSRVYRKDLTNVREGIRQTFTHSHAAAWKSAS
jgi:UDP-glucose 4-epimerase